MGRLAVMPVPVAQTADVRGRRRATMRIVVSSEPTGDRRAETIDALTRAARGDDAAFAEFYDRVAPAVHGTVLRVLREPAIAEEVTQDVFIELWRLAPRYDAARGSPTAWAVTVAHRRAVDRVRAEQSSRARDAAEAHRTAGRHDTVEDAALRRSEAAGMVAALRQLTDVQREAVELAYFGGFTYREVAALLDVPEGTVKTRIRDGLRTLRDIMG